MTIVVNAPESVPGSRLKMGPKQVTVKPDSLNPVHAEILGILSGPGGDRNIRDLSPSEYVNNKLLSNYYEMAKRRSAIYLSRGQTDQMTDALFAGKLYDQLEGIESHFGTKGSLRQGFNILLTGNTQTGTNTPIVRDTFEPANLIFSIGRPRAQRYSEAW